jgi:hypothetical protein
MGDDPMALLGLEGALKHYYYIVNTADLPKLQQAAKIIIRAAFGAPSCDSEKAPVMVLGAIDVAAAAAVSGSS